MVDTQPLSHTSCAPHIHFLSAFFSAILILLMFWGMWKVTLEPCDLCHFGGDGLACVLCDSSVSTTPTHSGRDYLGNLLGQVGAAPRPHWLTEAQRVVPFLLSTTTVSLSTYCPAACNPVKLSSQETLIYLLKPGKGVQRAVNSE